jgi:hypothetical protein
VVVEQEPATEPTKQSLPTPAEAIELYRRLRANTPNGNVEVQAVVGQDPNGETCMVITTLDGQLLPLLYVFSVNWAKYAYPKEYEGKHNRKRGS